MKCALLVGVIGEAIGMGTALKYLQSIGLNEIHELLDNSNIYIRSGHHCCQPLHRFYGIKSTARASLSFTSTPSEIDSLAEELKSVISFLKKKGFKIFVNIMQISEVKKKEIKNFK